MAFRPVQQTPDRLSARSSRLHAPSRVPGAALQRASALPLAAGNRAVSEALLDPTRAAPTALQRSPAPNATQASRATQVPTATQTPTATQAHPADPTTDEVTAYFNAQAAQRAFLGQQWSLRDYQPPLGQGGFDLTYSPLAEEVVVEIRYTVAFQTLHSQWLQQNIVDPVSRLAGLGDLLWSEDAKAIARRKISDNFHEVWGQVSATFWCQQPWWEQVKARLTIRIIEDDQRPNCRVAVFQHGQGMSAYAPGERNSADQNEFFIAVDKLDPRLYLTNSAGDGKLDITGSMTAPLPALPTGVKPADAAVDSTPAHELGHAAFGLPDSYRFPTPLPGQEAAFHQKHPEIAAKEETFRRYQNLVETEIGERPVRGDDPRVMSVGHQVRAEHLVTILTGLQSATGLDWGLEQQPARRVPLCRKAPAGAHRTT